MSAPLVSWLLCTHQADALLWRAMASCLGQSFTDFELLLVANGPKAQEVADQVQARFGEDSRVRVLISDVQLLNFNLSLGVREARGRYLARMDADDVSAADRLARQVAFMEQHPDVAVLGSAYELIDAQGRLHGRVDLPCSDADIRRRLFTANPFCHPSVMLRREIVAAAGAYLGGRNAEDYDLWCRLALRPQTRFANLPEPLLQYNVDPSGPARRSREAYANVVACQVRAFLLTGRWRWVLGATLTVGKLLLKTRRQ